MRGMCIIWKIRTRLERSAPMIPFTFSMQFAFPCSLREGPRCTMSAVGAYALACAGAEVPEGLSNVEFGKTMRDPVSYR